MGARNTHVHGAILRSLPILPPGGDDLAVYPVGAISYLLGATHHLAAPSRVAGGKPLEVHERSPESRLTLGDFTNLIDWVQQP
jgi:hypothetical protein